MNFQRKKKNNILIDARDDFTTILNLKKLVDLLQTIKNYHQYLLKYNANNMKLDLVKNTEILH